MRLIDKSNIFELWKNADCVCFDVDSTVCRNEAIDDLADFVGLGNPVQQITKEAMGGNMSFKEALKKRLSIIRPSLNVIQQFNDIQQNQLTPYIKELIDLLHSKEVPVYLVSGGFRLIINPIANLLNIDRKNVYANTLKFDLNGEYLGFDECEMTSESGGKARVIENLKKLYNYDRVIMIGDGATDLESCPPADGFIGFGGNVVRELVKQNSQWFVYCFSELIEKI
ncbi:unnamed protein product [Brachionus calyciflorus]|uniref:Phosphoserine phosphatase n=1 Tax=Brachionus calyciflorus TaxID=104777 RepID=A0A814BFC3_9BILA|nr:unnamed protein product [Brachionus calyciflorus]